jgi:hypothetical protein
MTPHLLVAWEPRWRNFRECISPAISRSAPPWAKECNISSLDRRGASLSFALHVVVGLLLIFSPDAPTSRVRIQDTFVAAHVEYIPADALPTIADASGASRGNMGHRSGRTALHGDQTIRVESQLPRVDLPAEFPDTLKDRRRDVLTTLISVPRQRVVRSMGAAPELPLPQSDQLAQLAAPSQPVQPASSPKLDHSAQPIPQELVVAAVAAPSPALLERPKLPVIHSALEPVIVAAPMRPAARERFADMPAMGMPEVVAPPSTAPLNGPRIAVPIVGVISAPDSGQVARTQSLSVPMTTVAAAPATGSMSPQPLRNLSGLLDPLQPQVLIVAKTDTGVPAIPANRRSATMTKARGDGSLSGIGLDGAGSGISRGAGGGSGERGTGNGASSDWRGRGASDTVAGLSSHPGPGGTGRSPGAPRGGVSVEGNVVTLGEFTDPAAKVGNVGPRRGHAITIVASSNSGGALNRYGTLKGERVYTVYLPVVAGLVVMEYSERSASQQTFDSDLVAPEPLRVEMTPELRRVRTVIACIVERDGSLRDIRVLESALAPLSHKLAALLADWKFRPALRGDEPVAVDALFGFQIDTR